MANIEEVDKIILEPYNYLLKLGGKGFRTKLIKAFNHWLRIPDKKLLFISETIEMFHNGSLLIDDIEDNSILRRGAPVAHNIYGIRSTINSANYVYFLGLEKIIKESPNELVSKAVQIFTEQSLDLHRGQGLDIYMRDTFKCPTEQQYLDIVKKKTGALFGMAFKLMQLFSNDKRDFSQLICLLGTYFQIRDDYENLKSLEYEENKCYCEDITEGKFSFPIIHGIHTHPEDMTLLKIIRKRTNDIKIKKIAVEKLESFGSFEYTLKVLREVDMKTRSEVEILGGNPYLTKVLDFLKSV